MGKYILCSASGSSHADRQSHGVWQGQITRMLVALLLLGLFSSSAARAQSQPLLGLAQSGDMLQITPAVAVVNSQAHTVTIQMANLGKDTIQANVSLQYLTPRERAVAMMAGTADSLKADSLEKVWSLASWIQDMPTSIKLAPKEKRAVTLHLKVPSTLQPGEYSAHVVAINTSRPQEQQGSSGGAITFSPNSNGGQGFTMQIQGGGGDQGDGGGQMTIQMGGNGQASANSGQSANTTESFMQPHTVKIVYRPGGASAKKTSAH